jgi:hypothetical protein
MFVQETRTVLPWAAWWVWGCGEVEEYTVRVAVAYRQDVYEEEN